MDQEGSAGSPSHGRGPRGDEGFDLSNPAGSFVSTVREVLFEPTNFFRRLPPRGRALNPLVFALACTLISFALGFLVAPLDPWDSEDLDLGRLLPNLVADGAEPTGVALLVVIFLVLLPLGIVLGLYVGAAVYHLLVLLFVRPTGTGFEATFRVYAYTSTVVLLSWIPILGYAASLYGLYLSFVGMRELHATTTGRAAAVVLAAVALSLVLVLPGLLWGTAP